MSTNGLHEAGFEGPTFRLTFIDEAAWVTPLTHDPHEQTGIVLLEGRAKILAELMVYAAFESPGVAFTYPELVSTIEVVTNSELSKHAFRKQLERSVHAGWLRVNTGQPRTWQLNPAVAVEDVRTHVPNEQQALLRSGDVARMFRVDKATVSRWGRDGTLPGLTTAGGHYRFRQEDVQALLGNEDHWLRPGEVTSRLNIYGKTLRKRIMSGELTAIKTIGGAYRILEADVARFETVSKKKTAGQGDRRRDISAYVDR